MQESAGGPLELALGLPLSLVISAQPWGGGEVGLFHLCGEKQAQSAG